MSSNSSGKKLEGFFTGKGFYIVLFLCARCHRCFPHG